MKIPRSVRINGVEFRVEYVPDLNDGENMLYGQIDYNNCVINLSETVGTAHEMRCLTFWHEVLHGIRNASGIAIQDEERIVEMFARGIYQILQDNGGRLFDLVGDNDAS